MHKLAKGLKKKKKGKKSKHKEEELFKPEELEAYRREHAAAGEEALAKNEEWRNFLSLTSGVDDILKKTQDDLDRIKSTSFFQRIPPKSETDKKKAQEEAEQAQHQIQTEEASGPKEEEPQLGIVPVSESESEEEEDDDIFNTEYIDVITAGEVKLAYIPESPTEKQDGDDPFDTSIAERAILGPAVERKGKKLVPLGAAVEVLTGRVQLPTCATKSATSRRQILKERDLLLGSFDSTAEPPISTAPADSPEKVKTLLDDDEIPLPDEPIDLSKTLYIPPPQPTETSQPQQSVLKQLEEDEDDKEFEALAAESLSKRSSSIVTSEALPKVLSSVVVEEPQNWKPFEKQDANDQEFDVEADDPFDTTFATNILPGKAELKLIEKEILENDVDFDPRAPTSENNFGKSALFQKRIPESELNLITPVHRDLLGGSTSDLSKLGDKPIVPTEHPQLEENRYCDPFDTSIVDTVTAPGQAELKCIEKEFLGDIKQSAQSGSVKISKAISIDDDDFNPRALEARKVKPRTLSRPDVLKVASKTVSFSVPSNQLGTEDINKVAKPLTPFYVRKNSVPGTESPDSTTDDPADPFDTSFVPNLAPGKAELKVIEKELFNPQIPQSQSLEDPDFDPRDENKVAKVAALEAIKEIANPKPKVHDLPPKTVPVDLLSASNDIAVKVLTPAAESKPIISIEQSYLSYADPFDTSIARNILPGKAELKLLENELIEPKAEATGPGDLLVHTGDTIIEKPLSPEPEQSFDIEAEDFDPFDTSFASNIQPGRAELKILESELI